VPRTADLIRFYRILEDLEARIGGKQRLAVCDGRMNWPARGVYFFFEPEEYRSDTGEGMRVVRVGSHALKAGSRTSLWHRLSQHRGVMSSGGGNHRGSIFRLIVGEALANRNHNNIKSWGVSSDQGRAARKLGLTRASIKQREQPLEIAVSNTIRGMPLLWVGIDDESGSGSWRGYIERNAIALLSNYSKSPLDPPSAAWLGYHSGREKVRLSGLWNSNHVDEAYDPDFLGMLKHFSDRVLPL